MRSQTRIYCVGASVELVLRFILEIGFGPKSSFYLLRRTSFRWPSQRWGWGLGKLRVAMDCMRASREPAVRFLRNEVWANTLAALCPTGASRDPFSRISIEIRFAPNPSLLLLYGSFQKPALSISLEMVFGLRTQMPFTAWALRGTAL